MATALARGLISTGFAASGSIVASDVSEAARRAFAEATGAAVTAQNPDVLARCRTIILAVKPQAAGEVVESLRGQWTGEHLLVSIVAGVPVARLSAWSGGGCRIIRVMPNTPCLVGAGASAWSRGPTATEADGRLVQELFSTVGRAVEVPEGLLDAVTGLSGSGPAYVFAVIEALSDGGVRMGLPRVVATQLAAQTVLGAARLVLETGDHPAALKDAVASPGGTTIAGLHALELGGLRGTLMNAVQAATLRSQELGRS